MRIYVSSTWENRISVKGIMKLLQGFGHELSIDWTDHELDDWRVSEQGKEKAGKWSADDIDAIGRSDCMILYLSGTQKIRTGSACELGAALLRGIPVIIVGRQEEPESPFLYHPNIIHVGTIREMLERTELK